MFVQLCPEMLFLIMSVSETQIAVYYKIKGGNKTLDILNEYLDDQSCFKYEGNEM